MHDLDRARRYTVVRLDPSPHRGRVRHPTIEAPRRPLIAVPQAPEQIARERHERLWNFLLQIPFAPVIQVAGRGVAVRDGHGAIRETDFLDERARRDESDVGLRRHAQRARRVRIERQEQAMTLAQEQPLEIARAEIPSRQVAVAAAIVEEGVHGSLGPHLVKNFDHALRAAVRDEIFVGQGEVHRPKMRCRATRAANTGSTRWRRQRCGSNASRQSHSKPIACTIRGGTRTRPASWSNTPPTPIAVRTDGRSGRFRAIQRSCAGMPYATRRTRAAAAWIRSRIASSFSDAGEPAWVPATSSEGIRRTSASPARSATPVAAPRRKTGPLTSCRT